MGNDKRVNRRLKLGKQHRKIVSIVVGEKGLRLKVVGNYEIRRKHLLFSTLARLNVACTSFGLSTADGEHPPARQVFAWM